MSTLRVPRNDACRRFLNCSSLRRQRRPPVLPCVDRSQQSLTFASALCVIVVAILYRFVDYPLNLLYVGNIVLFEDNRHVNLNNSTLFQENKTRPQLTALPSISSQETGRHVRAR